MRTLAAVTLTAGIAVMSSSVCKANDSSAEFEMGGLRFQRDQDIAMRAEDLSISTKQVAIAYTFFNRSPRDKTILVAFPMPNVVGSESYENVAIPTEDPDNPFDFRVRADGVPVTLHLERTALAGGVDQTTRLRQLHIPLMPTAAATNEALDHLPKAQWPELVKLGIGRIETYGTGGPMEDHLVANWTLRSAFTWTQTFPAMREIRLEQTYQPSVGGSAQTVIGIAGWQSLDDSPAYISKYCLEPNIVAAVQRAIRARKIDYAPFSEQRIAYILSTGANWAGPIGAFHLTVDKGDPGNLISFCADGVTRTGPTTFEVRKSDFVPTKDLFILILAPLN